MEASVAESVANVGVGGVNMGMDHDGPEVEIVEPPQQQQQQQPLPQADRAPARGQTTTSNFFVRNSSNV